MSVEPKQLNDTPKQETPVTMYVISSEQINQITQIASKVALEQSEKEQARKRREKKNKMVRNTKLLLQHYAAIKVSAEESIYDMKALERENDEFFQRLMEGVDDEVIIYSIRKSAVRSHIMTVNIEHVLEIYKERYTDAIHQKRYDIIYRRYISGEKAKAGELALEHHTTLDSVYKEEGKAVTELAYLLFGMSIISMDMDI